MAISYYYVLLRQVLIIISIKLNVRDSVASNSNQSFQINKELKTVLRFARYPDI